MQLKPSKPYVIFAPHIDDEMIGCWSLLSSGLVDQVYYFNDLESHRVDEAIKLSVQYGFKAVFVDYEHELRDWFNIIKQKIAGKILLLPSIKDQHPHHKIVNRWGKAFPNEKKYYSVDMNHKISVLRDYEREEKRAELDRFYPSQKMLWDRDAKYYLFESIQDSDNRKTIWVTFQKEGFHQYPDAPDEVAFLRHPHRHMFHFRVEIEVFHDDRELEFIMFKRELETLYGRGALELDYKSCEMLASDLEQYILTNYPGRCYNINVSEDNENGAVIYSGDW
jgi:hypothetical protein